MSTQTIQSERIYHDRIQICIFDPYGDNERTEEEKYSIILMSVKQFSAHRMIILHLFFTSECTIATAAAATALLLYKIVK